MDFLLEIGFCVFPTFLSHATGKKRKKKRENLSKKMVLREKLVVLKFFPGKQINTEPTLPPLDFRRRSRRASRKTSSDILHPSESDQCGFKMTFGGCGFWGRFAWGCFLPRATHGA